MASEANGRKQCRPGEGHERKSGSRVRATGSSPSHVTFDASRADEEHRAGRRLHRYRSQDCNLFAECDGADPQELDLLQMDETLDRVLWGLGDWRPSPPTHKDTA